MSVKSRLKHSIYNVLKQDNRGSYSARADIRSQMSLFADQLIDLGYKLETIHNLKPKHIATVVANWQQNELSPATIKNRVAAIRRTANLVGKLQIVPSNQELKLAPRQYRSGINLAIHNPDFSNINDKYIRMSLELQRVFGLRREEALKIKPHVADCVTALSLQPSWCKGGRGRYIPISNQEQRDILNKAKLLVALGDSLIPRDKSYIEQRRHYDYVVQHYASHTRMHGLRHAYAQTRYKELAGFECPYNGGPKKSEMSAEQKKLDHYARSILTEELGHSRIGITNNYCG